MIRVLVVDDDFLVARVHKGMVDRVPGFTVVGVAGTGEEALRLAGESGPDLILLDMHLPDIFGHEVLTMLRSAGIDADVLAISAARESDTVHGTARRGAVGYLLKPFTFEELQERLLGYADSVAVRADTGAYAEQGDIDRLFVVKASAPAAEPVPKGLSRETLELIRAALLERATEQDRTMSAAECAESVGVSRVSARRYLEFLCRLGEAQVQLRYGGTGRPQRRYLSTVRGVC